MKKTTSAVHLSCIVGMKVYDYHQSMLARNVMGRMEVILHTRGSVMMVETNS